MPWLTKTGEVPIVFGTYNMSPLGIPPTLQEVTASRYIQGRGFQFGLWRPRLTWLGAWVAFARDPHNGLRKYGWPDYKPNGEWSLIDWRLDGSNGTRQYPDQPGTEQQRDPGIYVA
jgi:hypothetical protein